MVFTNMMEDPNALSLGLVSSSFFGMFVTACTGLFDSVELEIGLQHYAEQAWIPYCPLMPLNTLINFGYIGLGMYWWGLTQAATEQGILRDKDSVLFYTFNIMTTIYGCVQLLRITTQRIVWAVLDQWCTPPFFALLLVWGLYFRHGWSTPRAIIIMALSILSYSLTLCLKIGFEISLGLHVLAAFFGGVIAYKRYPAIESLTYFYLALLSCSGFVLLKLLDHHLPEICFIFRYISGHFLSKICDVFQIYYVNNFFFDLTLEKAADISVVEQKQFFKSCEEDGFYERQSSRDIMYELPHKKKEF